MKYLSPLLVLSSVASAIGFADNANAQGYDAFKMQKNML